MRGRHTRETGKLDTLNLAYRSFESPRKTEERSYQPIVSVRAERMFVSYGNEGEVRPAIFSFPKRRASIVVTNRRITPRGKWREFFCFQ